MPFAAGRTSSHDLKLTKRPLPANTSRLPRTRIRATFVLLCGFLWLVYHWRSKLHDVPAGPQSQLEVSNPADDFFEVDGLLYSRDQRAGHHPIPYLIDEGKRAWKKKLSRQSRTLPQAVREYTRRYGRRPPRGFDKWFTFAKASGVILIDEYDQINRDLEPFLALPTELMQERSRLLVEDTDNYYHKGSFTLQIVGGKVAKVTGPHKDGKRAVALKKFLFDVVEYLPDLNVTFWQHDTPVIHTAGENKLKYTELARKGQTLPKSEWEDPRHVADYVGWEACCVPEAPLRKYMAGTDAGAVPAGRSFISDHLMGMEICRHPTFMRQHSLTSNYGIGPAVVLHWPLFSHSKTSMFSDILITPLEQYGDLPGPDPIWESKTINKLLWRGTTTGSRYDRATLWRSSQRSRLLNLANDKEGARDVLISDPDGRQRIKPSVSQASLNQQLFDIAFTDKPKQCQEDDGTCAAVLRTYRFDKKMQHVDANKYKYVIDVDGNGWSGRYFRLLSSRSVVLKSTAYLEWYQDRIQPWVHYVPVKLDYSDLHHIMTFFTGLDGSDGHDELAKEIGEAGKRWAELHWRHEDMETYMYRVLLEFARVMGPRDGTLDYDG